MNRRSFLLSSVALAAVAIVPKLAAAAIAPVAPTDEVIVEVLRVDGVWREVSFRVLSKGDIFRRKLPDGTYLDDGQAWIATTHATRPSPCRCVSNVTGRPLGDMPRRFEYEACSEPWGIQVEPADPAVVAVGEAAKDAPFPVAEAYTQLCR